MRIKRKKTYASLFLSDIHLLLEKRYKDHSHDDLFELLDDLAARRVRFRRVFLVGDAFESWFFSASRRLKKNRREFDRLFDRLAKVVASGGRRYFIIGNHDTTSFSMTLAPPLERYLRKRRWHVRSRFEDEELVVVHGHQGQYNRLYWVASIATLRFLNLLAFVWKDLFRVAERFYDRHLNHENPKDAGRKLEFYRRLSRVVHQRDRTLVAGHTHNFLCLPELNVVNTGDWIESRSFVIEVRGRKKGHRFVGFRATDAGKYEEVFRLVRRKPVQDSSG